MNTFTVSNEVHQYEQTKFFNESEWECQFDSIGGAVGGLDCGNPSTDQHGDTLIVEVKAQYKRANWDVIDQKRFPPREHCTFPGRGEFWMCFNSNLVIEPDTDCLGAAWYSDKPIYDSAGNTEGDI